MAVLRDMAVKEGFVDPSFPQQISDIDRFSQTIRDQILRAIVDKRAKKVKIEPKKLLKEIIDEL